MSETENLHPDPASPFRNHAPLPDRRWAAILEEAEQKSLWIYHPQSENWYSPAEFVEKYSRSIRENDDFCRELRLCRPEEGLQVMRRMLKEATDELDRLADKLIIYYRNAAASPVHS